MDATEAKTFLLTKRETRGKPPAAWTLKKLEAEKVLGRTLADVRGEADNAAKAAAGKTVRTPKHVAAKCPTCNGTGRSPVVSVIEPTPVVSVLGVTAKPVEPGIQVVPTIPVSVVFDVLGPTSALTERAFG